MTDDQLFHRIEESARNNAAETFQSDFRDLIVAATGPLAAHLKTLHFELLRGGVHYDSVSMGRWFRGVWDHAGFPPFGGKGAAVKGTWERFYDTLPPGINLLTDRSMKSPFIVQFGGKPVHGTSAPILHVTEAEIQQMNVTLDLDDLFERMQHLKSYDKLELFKDFPQLDQIQAFAKKLKSWFAGWSDTPRSETELALSFLFTWYPTLKGCVDGKSPLPMAAVVLPLPEHRPPDSCATMAALFRTAGVLDAGTIDQSIEVVRNVFSPVLNRLLAVDAQVLMQRPAKISLRLERVVRGLQYITGRSIEEHDRWKEWRDVFPVVPESAQAPEGGDANWRWDIPMWGASTELVELYENIKRAVSGPTPKFEMVFLYSPPGCGKENIARLCHYLSPRSHDRNLVETAFRKTSELFQPDPSAFIKLLGRRRMQLDDRTQPLLDIAEICDNPAHTVDKKSWDFNYFVAQGGFISRREAYRDLVGDLRNPKDQQIGLLVRATASGGTVFLDELNTMKDVDANLFLRIAEKPHEVELPGLASPIELNCLVIFASNETPKQLEAHGWNPAVLTRIAKPGRYFEIPPLEARPVDIAISLAYYLERRMSTIEHFDPDALRWLCRLPWRGNYRDLMAVLDRLMEKLKTQPKVRQRRVYFEDLLGAFLDAQV